MGFRFVRPSKIDVYNTISLSNITQDTTVYAYGLGGKQYLGKISSDSADDYHNSLSTVFKVYTAAILDSITIYPQDTGQFVVHIYRFPTSGGLPIFETRDTIYIRHTNVSIMLWAYVTLPEIRLLCTAIFHATKTTARWKEVLP